MAATSLADRLRARIDDEGPITVAAYVEAALYDELDGFYATGGHAGRRGDFLTAPEVGPLFGAVISNAVDAWWRTAGEPNPFVVAEHGAGPGTLARTVTVADGACLRAGALEWVMVERSDAQRRHHPEGGHLRSVAALSAAEPVDVVFANELLDNLPFDIARRSADGWVCQLVTHDGDRFVLVDGAPVAAPINADDAAVGSMLPMIATALTWIGEQRTNHPDARVVVFDYAAAGDELLARAGEWLRAYRGHDRLDDWLVDPGSCDITIDLPIEPLAATGAAVESQADFLRLHGIDALVEEGRRGWEAGAHVGDLAALRARSRVAEAAALLDADGMGAFTVFAWSPRTAASTEGA